MHNPEADPHRPDDRSPVVIVVVTADPPVRRGTVARLLRVLAVVATPVLAVLRFLGVL